MFDWERRRVIEASIERAKVEILGDVDVAINADGERMPRYPQSFSQLHDYVDANTYGGWCDEGADFTTDEINLMQDRVDEWLLGRAHAAAEARGEQIPVVDLARKGREEATALYHRLRKDTFTLTREQLERSVEVYWAGRQEEGTFWEAFRAQIDGINLVLDNERAARGRWLTLGELRRRTEHLPDDTPITIATPDGGWWLNAEMDDLEIPERWPSDEASSLIISTRDDFDTRQW